MIFGMLTPKYFAVSTSSSICPSVVYMVSSCNRLLYVSYMHNIDTSVGAIPLASPFPIS